MSDKCYRSTYMSADLDAVASNSRAFSTLHLNKTMMVVVRVDAYGLGSVKVARHLMENSATFFAVATLDEAIELRIHGITVKILALGVLPAKDTDKATQHRVILTVPSKQWLKETIKNISGEQGKKLWLHTKLDIGMGRLGIRDTKMYQEVIEVIQQYEQFVFESVSTHLACADEPGDMTTEQYQRFKDTVNEVIKPEYIHCQNSAGSLLVDCQLCNVMRPGISLYGYYPSEYVQQKVKIHLKLSVQLIANVAQTETLQAGGSASYGTAYIVVDPTTIASSPIGYADSCSRIMRGSFVNVNGHRYEITGRVCMDQTIVKVPDQVKAGSSIVLIDNHRESLQSVEMVAEK